MATPLSASPALRSGATCGARVWRGLARTRCAQTIASPDPPNPALLGASRGAKGEEHPHVPLLRSAPTRGRKRHALRKLGRAKQRPVGMFCPLCPSGCAEERRVWRIRARDCLSEVKRSEFERDPAKPEHRRLPRSEAQGTQTVGSPFLWFLSFGDAKERDSPAGRLPASALEKGMRPNQPPHQILQNQ